MVDVGREFRVRPATPADAEAVCAVHVASIRRLCARDYTAEQIEVWAGGKHPDRYVRAMAEGETFFVAEGLEATPTVIGFSSVLGDEVRAVYVHPDHVGVGVGRALLAAVEEHARDGGVEVLRLNSTTTAREFYTAHGYQNDGESIFDMLGVGLPCVKMSKRLSG